MNDIKHIADEIKEQFHVQTIILDENSIGVNDNKYILKISDIDFIEERARKIVDYINELDNVYSVNYTLSGEYTYEIEVLLECE